MTVEFTSKYSKLLVPKVFIDRYSVHWEANEMMTQIKMTGITSNINLALKELTFRNKSINILTKEWIIFNVYDDIQENCSGVYDINIFKNDVNYTRIDTYILQDNEILLEIGNNYQN